MPYSAVYYDAKGAPWVYVNTQPLTFERQRITVERVVGDMAVLSDGPPLGTPVVITGAPLLYGAECSENRQLRETDMFRWIIGSSLQFRFLVLGVAAALIVFGSLRVQKMPVDVFPEFAAPVVEVQTEALGLSAKEVESLITLNLEELLSGVPWLKSIRSKSVTGLSSIVLSSKPERTS